MRTAPLILLVALIILISLMAAAKDTIADNGNFTSCLVTFWRRGTLCNSVSVRFTPESRHREGWPSCVVLLRYC
jgi:hypothetical protein